MSLTHYRPKRTSHSFVNLRYKGSSLFLFPSVSSNEAAFEKVLWDNLIIMIYFYSLIYSYIIRYFEGHGLKYNHSNTSFKMTSKLDREIASRRNVGTWTRCTERRSTRQKKTTPRRGFYIFTDPMLRSKCGARCTQSKKRSRRRRVEGKKERKKERKKEKEGKEKRKAWNYWGNVFSVQGVPARGAARLSSGYGKRIL